MKIMVMSGALENNTAETVNRFKRDEGVAGWFLRDEPTSLSFPQMKAFRDRILQEDTTHMLYLNLLPVYVSPKDLGTTSYREYLKRFVDEVDLGFLRPMVGGEMLCIDLQEDHLMAILSPSHPLASRPVLTLAELAKEPYILLEEGDINESLRTFRQNQLEPNIQYRVHDDYTIMSMVERNLGVSIISSIFLENPSYRLAIRPIDPPVTRTLGVAFRHLETMPTATRHFVDLIVQKYGSIEKGRAQWNELFR